MASIITAYIDDSKDSRQEKYVIAAAVVGTKSDWNAFNRGWRNVLLQEPAICYYHSTEWRGLKKEFKILREDGKATESGFALANAKRNALLGVIKDHLAGISVAVDVQAWKRVKNDHPRPLVIAENPYKTALQELIHAIAKEVDTCEHKVQFICDSDNQAPIYQQVYRNFREKNQKTAKKISSTLYFADDEKSYGLQAADLIAHAINQVHQQYGLEARNQPPPRELIGVMSNIHIWDYDRGMAILDAQTSED